MPSRGDYALADVLQWGLDDAGKTLSSGDATSALDLARLWINPVQWYKSAPLHLAWARQLRERLQAAGRTGH